MINLKLTAHNGAELTVSENEFSCNGILFKNHADELEYTDNNSSTNIDNLSCWGTRSDYGYSGLHDGALKNVAVMLKHYPETKEQFINYILLYGSLTHKEIVK